MLRSRGVRPPCIATTRRCARAGMPRASSESTANTNSLRNRCSPVWVVRVGGDDGELRPWHYIYVYSIESRLMKRVRYDSHIPKSRAPDPGLCIHPGVSNNALVYPRLLH